VTNRKQGNTRPEQAANPHIDLDGDMVLRHPRRVQRRNFPAGHWLFVPPALCGGHRSDIRTILKNGRVDGPGTARLQFRSGLLTPVRVSFKLYEHVPRKIRAAWGFCRSQRADEGLGNQASNTGQSEKTNQI
jgi:hypothetical protein